MHGSGADRARDKIFISRNRAIKDMIGVQEVFMKFILKKAVLAAVFTAFCFSITVPASYSADPASDTRQKDTIQAISELTKLGVPLQKDPKGDVRWIEAKKGELNDKAMSLLPHLPKLEWLEIGNGIITPDGMKHLGKCTALKRLYIHDITLQGEELAWLSSLKQLEALSLQRTKIGGKFLKHLNAVDTLKVLNLSKNNITNDDIAEIARFKNLEVLALADTQITSACFNELTEMARLNELNVSNCTVMDYDLSHFLSMPNLRIVYAEGCNLSDYGIGNIIARFPMLAIFN